MTAPSETTLPTIAIIGQGTMGREHAAAWAELGLGERIRYVCTPRPRPPLAGAPAAGFVRELDEVLDDDDVDVLSVCTPTPSHADIAIRALAAGKSVLLEKPIALTHDDARAISRAADEAAGTLMVGHVVRFVTGYRKLREDVEAGRLGTVRSVRASRHSVARTPASWLDDESASGGMLVDFAIHDFDQLSLFLGTPVAVTAVRSGAGPGEIETTVQYAGGGVGHVSASSDMPAGYAFTSSLAVEGVRGGEVVRGEYRHPSDDADVLGTPRSPYAAQAAYFLDCVRAGAAPAFCPTDAAISALDLALAARTSLLTGRTVNLP